MKKLLALVLALVMTLGLATVSASAAPTVKYADKDDISYLEAADVLSEVGVFNGKGDNFAPKDNLNRAEAAKLVAYLMLGNKTAETIKGNGNKFSDVPADHYAAGYIEYLATAGVVSGVGDGKFNPNGQVTAVQFGKMLCVALGYDAQVEGFVGESWNINIMKQANDDKLFKTLDVGSNDALTREQAAQMCLNALKARTVEYESKGDTLQINNSTVILNAKKAKDKTTGDSKGHAINWDYNNSAAEYYLNLGEDLYNGDLKMEKTNDDFGRPANKWTYKSHDIGTYADGGDLKGEYTDEVKNGPVYDLVGKTVYDDLKNGDSTLEYWEDGVYYAVAASDVDKFILKNGDTALSKGYGPNANTTNASTGRGTLTQVYVNDDTNDVTITAINTYVFKASSDYRASTEDIVIGVPTGAVTKALDKTRLELVDFPSIKDMKKDDYILATLYQNSNGNNYTVKTAVKAELLTAKVDKYVFEDTVTLDGTTYKYDKKIDATSKGTEYSIGQETTVVLDKYGYIMYVDEAVVSANYVFISELFQNGGSTTKVQANAYFTDGTNATITVKEIGGVSGKTELMSAVGTPTKAETVDANNSTGVVADTQQYVGWYTYSKNSSGEYTMNKLGNTYKQEIERTATVTTATKMTASDKVQFIENGNAVAGTYKYDSAVAAKSAKANDKTIFVVTYGDKNDVDVYTGVKNLPEINLATDNSTASAGTVFSVLDNKGYAKYVFASVEGKYSVFGSENESLLYIVKLDKKNVISSDTTYYTYKALDENAKEIKVEADGSSAFGTDTTIYKTFYKTSRNSSDRYTRGEVVPNTGKYVSLSGRTEPITASNGTLSIANQSYTLGDNYKLVVVSKADALNKLQGADYEANVVTAEGLDAMVSGYDVTYNFEAKKDSNTNDKLVEAYVTITAAVPNGKTSGSTTSTTKGILAVVLPDTISTTASDFQVYYAGSTPSSAEVNFVLNDALTSRGYVLDSVASNKYNLKEMATGMTVTGALNDTSKGSELVAAVGLSGTITGVENKSTDIVVVESGKTLTIANGATLTVKSLVADGNVVIENGGKLVLSANALNTNTYGLVITENGDVTVKKGGEIDGSAGIKGKVNYLSTSLVSSGSITLNQLDVAGDATFEGGTVTITTINANSGAEIVVKGDSVVSGKIAVPAAGGSVEIGGTATVATVENKASSSAVKMTSSTATVQSVATGDGTNGITTYSGDEAAAGETNVGAAKIELTVSTSGIGITAISTGTLKTYTESESVYVLSADTKTVDITVTNWSAATATVNASANGYTVAPATKGSNELTAGQKDKKVTFNITK